MAIPFNIPTNEQTEEQYRSMDDLLIQLYNVLRQILVYREPEEQQQRNTTRSTPSTNPRHVEDPVVAAAAEATPVLPVDTELRLPLPDIIQCSTPTPTLPRRPIRRRPSSTTASTPQPPPRRGRRRPRVNQEKEDEKVVTVEPPVTAYNTRWMEAGSTHEVFHKVEIRDNWAQVGEDLRMIADGFHAASLQDDHQSVQDANQKGMSLLSLLVPPPFSGCWVAVIVLLGWRVLQCAR